MTLKVSCREKHEKSRRSEEQKRKEKERTYAIEAREQVMLDLLQDNSVPGCILADPFFFSLAEPE